MRRIDKQRMRALTGNERGVAVVEFALLLPVLLLILFGILDFGRSMNYVNDATHLANEGARFAMVNQNPGGSGVSLPNYIKGQADTGELRDNAHVCISFPSGTSQVGQPVKVTVSFGFTWLNFLGNTLGVPDSTFSSSSTMRIEQTPSYSAGCSA